MSGEEQTLPVLCLTFITHTPTQTPTQAEVASWQFSYHRLVWASANRTRRPITSHVTKPFLRTASKVWPPAWRVVEPFRLKPFFFSLL